MTKNIVSTLGLSLTVLLSACGGGGGETAAIAPPAAAASAPAGLLASGLDVTEFLGTWIRSDSGTCYTSNAYGNYFFINNNIVITTDSVSSNVTLYTDAACTLKAGKFSETATAAFGTGSIAGKTNVVQRLFSFKSFTSNADGGSGLTFTKIPDGTFSGVKGSAKGLIDVDGGKLFFSSQGSPLDANGYATTIDYNGAFFYTR